MQLKPEHRQTISLVLATWILSGVLYLIPYHVFTGASTYVLVSVVRYSTPFTTTGPLCIDICSPVSKVQARSRLAAFAGVICASVEYRVPSSVPL